MLQEIKDILRKRRFDAEKTARANKLKITQYPKINEIFQEFTALRLKKAKAEADNLPFDKQKLLDVSNKLDSALKTINLSQADLVPQYFCPKCEDKGLIDGHECECVKGIRSELNRQNSHITTFHDFEEINYNYIKNTELIDIIKKLKALSQSKANRYLMVTICGNTGAGKTFILQCMANEYSKNNKFIVMDTAFKINNELLKLHTTFNENRSTLFDKYLLPDVLIIDDLGAEPIYNNVTKEYFYLIINQRTIEKKLTLISTNLSPNDIEARYGQRIASRVVDKTHNTLINFNNIDIRIGGR